MRSADRGAVGRSGTPDRGPAVLHAPYAFVPLSAWVYEPDWASKVSQDIPFKDGSCGWIDIKITAKTPLLIGGERRRPNGENGLTEVYSYALPDGRYAIPGSTLRGMLRNVLQIATFGRMGPWIDNNRHEKRDPKTKSKIPHKLSTLDVLANTKRGKVAAHVEAGAPDFAALLFGKVTEGEDPSAGAHVAPADWASVALKGRISFECAIAQPKEFGSKIKGKKTVLGAPKAQFYPTYVSQPSLSGRLNGGEYASYTPTASSAEQLVRQPELSGWKRYPARGSHDIAGLPPGIRGEKTVSQLFPLPSETSFTGRIWFHNLKREELGALLWTITWGGKKGGNGEPLRHRIGMGKPFGLGEIEIEVSHLTSQPNDSGAGDASDEASVVGDFVRHMNEAHREAGKPTLQGEVPTWERSQQVLTLLATADPTIGAEQNLNYMTLNTDTKGRIRHSAGTNMRAILPPYPLFGGGPPVAADRDIWPRPAPATEEAGFSHHALEATGRSGTQSSRGAPVEQAGLRKGQGVFDREEGDAVVDEDTPAASTMVKIRYLDGGEPVIVPVSRLVKKR